MQQAEQGSSNSWRIGQSPLALSEIFSPDTSVAIWERQCDPSVSQYFVQAFPELGMGVRGVFDIHNLVSGLQESLPDCAGKQQAVEDIYLLSDMLTCLFDCSAVGLRLAPLTSAMCPRFHIDKIPVRLVNTYLGPGTQWLPLESLHDERPENAQGQFSETKFGQFYHRSQIQQMCDFDVGLLKGAAWHQQEHMAAVHRSCQVKTGEKRVLLTLDPM